MALVGVTQLAEALGVSKGQVSKRASAGSIPIADRDGRGHPLFDVDQVRATWSNNVNPLMRRRGDDVAPPAAPQLEHDELEEATPVGERRSPYAPEPTPREPSGLLRQQVVERQLRNRRLVRQLAEDEGLLVLAREVENTQTTIARQTRDGVTAFLADGAAELYAFVAHQRTEGELRIWLSQRSGKAFDEVERALEAETGDEFDDGANAAANGQQSRNAGTGAAP
jgi:hypothetical protein